MRKTIHGDTDMGNFRTNATIILQSTSVQDILQQHFETLNAKMDEFVRNGELLLVFIISNNATIL